VKALRQVLAYAVAVGLIDKNPAKLIPNPGPKRTEVLPFATVAEVEMVPAEMLPHYRAIPLVGCLTGLRPSVRSIGSPLLFTTRTGGPIDLHRWRARNWTPALRAADLTPP